jgi:hypothetical protein
MDDTPPPDVFPLYVERNFPADERKAFIRRWVGFLLDDLNVQGDRLRLLAATNDPPPTAAIHARVERIIQALGLGPDGSVSEIWRFVEEKVEAPTDLWGPIRALDSLEPDRKRYTHWLATLEDPRAAETLLDSHLANVEQSDYR